MHLMNLADFRASASVVCYQLIATYQNTCQVLLYQECSSEALWDVNCHMLGEQYCLQPFSGHFS